MQIIKKIRDTSMTCPQIKYFQSHIKNITDQFIGKPIQIFSSSNQAKILISEFQKLQLKKIYQLISQLPQQQNILALSVLRSQHFSLILVIVPKNLKFDWHNHPNMFGTTKCLYGKFNITSIDITKISLWKQPNHLIYQTKNLKLEQINAQNYQITTISPTNFNIHKIQALQQSCFLDLLIPDYPQNYCVFYQTVQQTKDYIIIKVLEESTEEIIDVNMVLDDTDITESFSSILQPIVKIQEH